MQYEYVRVLAEEDYLSVAMHAKLSDLIKKMNATCAAGTSSISCPHP